MLLNAGYVKQHYSAEDGMSGSLSEGFRQLPSCTDLSTHTGAKLRASHDLNATWAVVIALGARNGVEDLHASGAFSDRQAPSLNRCLRGRVYEVLIALRRHNPDRPDDPYRGYLKGLAASSSTDPTRAAIVGAVARAVEEFAVSDGVASAVALELTEAATGGALEVVDDLWRLNDEEAQLDLQYLLRSIPMYWEHPQISPEFRALLERRK
jgi:hypothetical protein